MEELKKPNGKIDYVIGMLETLVEMDSIQSPVMPYTPSYPMMPVFPSGPGPTYLSTNVGKTIQLTEEEILAQKYAGGPVAAVQ